MAGHIPLEDGILVRIQAPQHTPSHSLPTESTRIGVRMNELRERIASVQHAIWSHWMKYLFTCGTYNLDGSWTMPKEKVDRWTKQMNTTYQELSEAEKESDRHQADKVIAVL